MTATAISVLLIVPDAEAAMVWYRDALGAQERWDLGGVAGLDIDGAPFFIHEDNPDNPRETSPRDGGPTHVRIELFVDDPDAVIDRAIAAGATADSEITEHELLGTVHRQGTFHDPFGHKWSVGNKVPLAHQ